MARWAARSSGFIPFTASESPLLIRSSMLPRNRSTRASNRSRAEASMKS